MRADQVRERASVSATGCWEWRLHRDRRGYGKVSHAGAKGRLAHRVAYELFVGPIPADMTVDHLCFNPPCINPAHLRLLSRTENSSKKQSLLRTECRHGHPFSAANTYSSPLGGRACRECRRRANRRASAKKAS